MLHRLRWLSARRRERSTGPRARAGGRRIGDSEAAALLAAHALVEIRYLAWRCVSGEEQPSLEQLQRIHFLADLAHNLPGIAWDAGSGRLRRDRQAMQWVWSTAGPDAQAWMLGTIEYMDCVWTPPSPAGSPVKGVTRLPLWRELSAVLGSWPVRAPRGNRPLPAAAWVVKALNTQQIVDLHEQAARLRLGLGSDAAWLQAHLDPDGTHYLVPDPAPYYWPDPDTRRWWECRELLRMADGTQASSSVAVLPERFAALPDNLPRRQQRRLVHVIRAVRYDLYLWGQDHKGECSPDRCGYSPTRPAE